MANTSTDLSNRALEKLLLVGTGQSPDSEDTAAVLAVVPKFAAFISGIDIYTIGDLNDIDDDAFEWLSVYLAYFCALDFGKPQDDGMRQAAEYNLKRLTATKPTKEVLAGDYF
jgi:hypothetical protein